MGLIYAKWGVFAFAADHGVLTDRVGLFLQLAAMRATVFWRAQWEILCSQCSSSLVHCRLLEAADAQQMSCTRSPRLGHC